MILPASRVINAYKITTGLIHSTNVEPTDIQEIASFENYKKLCTDIATKSFSEYHACAIRSLCLPCHAQLEITQSFKKNTKFTAPVLVAYFTHKTPLQTTVSQSSGVFEHLTQSDPVLFLDTERKSLGFNHCSVGDISKIFVESAPLSNKEIHTFAHIASGQRSGEIVYDGTTCKGELYD